MKKNILIFIIATTGLFSCKQSNNSKTGTVETKVPDSIKNINKNNTFNDKDIYTNYKYVDTDGKNVIIKNGFPKGGLKYIDPNGKVYIYAVFWTQIINETVNPFELTINFPTDSFELPSSPGRYFKILLPPDTLTLDKFPLFNYGLTDLESFLDNVIHKSSSLKRTIIPKESSSFYVVTLFNKGVDGTLRTGLSLKEQNIFYRINDKEIHCGKINLKNLILQK